MWSLLHKQRIVQPLKPNAIVITVVLGFGKFLNTQKALVQFFVFVLTTSTDDRRLNNCNNACTSVSILAAGDFLTKYSGRHFEMHIRQVLQLHHDIMNLAAGFVTVMFIGLNLLNKRGITDPREPNTFP